MWLCNMTPWSGVFALIEAGASLIVVTGSINGVELYVRPGTTPLHMAAQNGNFHIIRVLLQVPLSLYLHLNR